MSFPPSSKACQYISLFVEIWQAVLLRSLAGFLSCSALPTLRDCVGTRDPHKRSNDPAWIARMAWLAWTSFHESVAIYFCLLWVVSMSQASTSSGFAASAGFLSSSSSESSDMSTVSCRLWDDFFFMPLPLEGALMASRYWSSDMLECSFGASFVSARKRRSSKAA